MLDFLRKKRQSLFIILIFFVIIIGFVFWGVGPTGTKKGAAPEVVARVDGVPITATEYANLYRRQLDYYRDVFKDRLTDDLLERLNLRQRTLDALIDRLLILNEASRQKVRVGKEEVQKRIMSLPIFQKDGAFDKELYFTILQRNRIKPADFEKSVEQELLIEKMRDTIIRDIAVSDEEVRRAFTRENRLVAFDYIRIDPKAFLAQVKVDDDEARDFFRKNGERFMVPTRLKAFLAYVDKDGFVDEVEVPEEELRSYYERHISDYREPKQVRARHILIRPERSIENREEALKAAKEKAEAILKRLKAGEDFAELAREFSQDPGSASKGGDLGYFGRGTVVQPFEEAAFALEKGQLSDLVETEYGFHIIRVDDIRGGKTTPFEEARKEIEMILKRERSQEEARKRMVAFRRLFEEGASLETLEKEASGRGIRTRLTGFFTEQDRGEELVRDAKLRDAVFTLEAGGVSRIVETPQRFYVIKVVERVERHVPPYEDVADKVKETLLREKARKLARKKAEDLLKAALDGRGFRKLAKEAGVNVERTDFFTLSHGFVPGVGIFVGDREDLFDLERDNPYYPELIPHAGGFYVFRLAATKGVDEKRFEEQKAELTQRLLEKKRQDAVRKWLSKLRSKAEITVNEDLL